jgi:small neutral amino acid transporter SnatA (MarC family)
VRKVGRREPVILPLAATMLIGPGIMAAIILVTNSRAIPASIAYVVGFRSVHGRRRRYHARSRA